ncbi:hypothetical protein ACFXTO_006274 [Malus domestica]
MPNAGIQQHMMPPDISAPGAEFGCKFTDSPIASITQLEEGKKRVKYNMLSGTSVSYPRAASAAEYMLKHS